MRSVTKQSATKHHLRQVAVFVLRNLPDGLAERHRLLESLIATLPEDCDLRPFAIRLITTCELHRDEHQQLLRHISQ